MITAVRTARSAGDGAAGPVDVIGNYTAFGDLLGARS